MRRLLLLAVVLGLAACDGTIDDDLDPQLVVSASLGTEEPLPSVFVSRVSPLLEAYDFDDVAVDDAEVTVSLLAADGSVEQAYPFERVGPGRYDPSSTSTPRVLPDRTYRLEVVVGDERLTAETIVPPSLAVIEPPPDEVPFGFNQGPELVVSRSSTPERPARFVISARALAPAAFEAVEIEGETFYRSVPDPATNLPTPSYARFLGCEEEAEGTLLCEDNPAEQGIEVGSSPVLNEDSYQIRDDGSVLVQIPFLAFGYYGPAQIRLTSVDAALEAFIESLAVQGGGSTLSPGEIPNVITNVEGGLGVFGSFSNVDVRTSITEG